MAGRGRRGGIVLGGEADAAKCREATVRERGEEDANREKEVKNYDMTCKPHIFGEVIGYLLQHLLH